MVPLPVARSATFRQTSLCNFHAYQMVLLQLLEEAVQSQPASSPRSQKYGLSHAVSHGLLRLASTKSCAGSSLKLAPSSYLAAFLGLSIGNVHLDRLDVARLDMSFFPQLCH